ncbi:MAG: hypothetical protein NTY14_07145 [Candidatus Omnitrophica bacterium]|nr:hypothetical protein [Candidatus Omnitrophota bacterium]
MKNFKIGRFFFLVLILCLPGTIGWQKVELKELLETRKNKQEALTAVPAVLKPLDISSYGILEKVSSALFKLKTVEVETEVWLENPLFHIKSDFKNCIHNVDNYKADGRISLSLTLPNGASTSQWVQTFEIGGIPFTWNREKRIWEKKELEINGKDAKAVLSFSVLRSLFTINERQVDPSTVKILGVEKRKGKDCFVLGYSLDPEMFKRWNLVGSISMKLWISQEDFLPQTLRSEGKIGEMYLLQVVNYSNFNRGEEIVLPQAISDEVKIQKDSLKTKIKSLLKEVASIRGWDVLENIQVQFIDRVSLRKQLEEVFNRDFSKDRLEKEGLILSWLGLLPDNADYKESLINSEIASLAGLYDPKLKTIFIGDWIHPVLAEPVLVHEIAHAYQDRQVTMPEFQGDKASKQDLDFSTARHALLEGEATAIMLEYILRKEGANFQELGDIFALIEDKIIKNSEYSRQNLQYNIYGYGANYIQYYLKDSKWADLEVLYKNAPVSMNQILHPYRSFADKKQDNTAIDGEQDFLKEVQLPAGWAKIYSNHLGEFYLLLSLRQFLDKDTAEQAASGWKKDRITLYQNGKNQKLVLLRTKWNSLGDMKVYLGAFKDWLKKRYPQMTSREKDQASLITTPEGSFYLRPVIDELLVVWGRGQSPEEFGILTDKISY